MGNLLELVVCEYMLLEHQLLGRSLLVVLIRPADHNSDVSAKIQTFESVDCSFKGFSIPFFVVNVYVTRKLVGSCGFYHIGVSLVVSENDNIKNRSKKYRGPKLELRAYIQGCTPKHIYKLMYNEQIRRTNGQFDN